ncbi:MAG: NIPSNAP family protein [bacterium]|nr:NIPSNAP family protein [bacterium]
MIIVHDIFICKPGNASKMAKLFKEWADQVGKPTESKVIYVMTDMTGQWHRVIVASTHESLAAYEENNKNMMADTPENRAMNERFKDMNEMYISGSREIYKVW